VPNVKQRLGIGTPLGEASPEEILGLLAGGALIELDNGWQLTTARIAGDEVVEVVLNGVPANRAELESYGCPRRSSATSGGVRNTRRRHRWCCATSDSEARRARFGGGAGRRGRIAAAKLVGSRRAKSRTAASCPLRVFGKIAAGFRAADP